MTASYLRFLIGFILSLITLAPVSPAVAGPGWDDLPDIFLEETLLRLPAKDLQSVSLVNFRTRSIVKESKPLLRRFRYSQKNQFISLPQDIPGYSRIAGDNVRSVAIDDGKIYLGTTQGLSISDDFGQTFWNVTSSRGLDHSGIENIWAHAHQVYVRTISGEFVSHDGGISFRRLFKHEKYPGEPMGRDICKVNQYWDTSALLLTTIFSVSRDGGQTFAEYKSDDWPLSSTGSTPQACAVSGDLICVGHYRGFSLSQDGGKTFQYFGGDLPLLAQRALKKHFITGNKLYLTGNGVSILTFPPRQFPEYTVEEVLRDVYTESVYVLDERIFVPTWKKGLLYSRDYGKTFESHPSFPTHWDLKQVVGIGNTIYVSSESTVYVSEDRGDHFHAIGAERSFHPRVSRLFVNSRGLFIAADEGLYFSDNHGETFTIMNGQLNGLGSHWNPGVLSVFESGGTLYAGTSLGLFVSENQGHSFQFIRLNQDHIEGVRAIGGATHSGDERVYIGTDNGRLLMTSDHGKTFRSIGNELGVGSYGIEQISVSGNSIFVQDSRQLFTNPFPLVF